jgi:dephospho-CoA kinase
MIEGIFYTVVFIIVFVVAIYNYACSRYRKSIIDILTKYCRENPKSKILIVGQAGSGKSCLSKSVVHESNVIPSSCLAKSIVHEPNVISLDEAVYGPNWSSIPFEKAFEKVQDQISKFNNQECNKNDPLIIEGVYSLSDETARTKIIQELFSQGTFDFVIWIDVPVLIRLKRILLRSLKRKLGIESSPQTESLYSIYKMIKTVWFTRNSTRKDIETVIHGCLRDGYTVVKAVAHHCYDERFIMIKK